MKSIKLIFKTVLMVYEDPGPSLLLVIAITILNWPTRVLDTDKCGEGVKKMQILIRKSIFNRQLLWLILNNSPVHVKLKTKLGIALFVGNGPYRSATSSLLVE